MRHQNKTTGQARARPSYYNAFIYEVREHNKCLNNDKNVKREKMKEGIKELVFALPKGKQKKKKGIPPKIS